jgi:D-glycero-D-manno-heptose 1,7-bisphosphate phosphatase
VKRAVFLDRDGVINEAPIRDGRPYSPATLAEFRILPGVPEALRTLDARGFVLIVATNQPDVGAGKQERDVVEAMHRRLMAELPLRDVVVCYHTDDAKCDCRKPRPGMLRRAAEAWDVDLRSSYMIGDRWRDVDAGRAAGCRTIFIDRGYTEPLQQTPHATCRDLPEAAALILARAPEHPEAADVARGARR